jgi:hypothetical protein
VNCREPKQEQAADHRRDGETETKVGREMDVRRFPVIDGHTLDRTDDS